MILPILELFESLLEVVFNGVEVDYHIITSVLDCFGRPLHLTCLTFDLNFVLQGVRSSVARKFDFFVSEELHADNVAESVIFVINHSSPQINLVFAIYYAVLVEIRAKHLLSTIYL